LTSNDVHKNEWWNWFYLSSQMPVEEPGDRIAIPPGKHVTRVVPLDVLLRGCPLLPDGLPAGRFAVQLRLGDVVSNVLEIDVAAK
jgi:hypothetical protein